MKDLIITIDSDTRKVKFSREFIGLTGENLQGDIVVDFIAKSGFVSGEANLEVEQDGAKYILAMNSNINRTYTLPIKASLLSKAGTMKCQIVITQEETDKGVPVFKSEVFSLPCIEAINANGGTIPEEYPSWLESANAKLAEVDEATIRANTISADLEYKVATDYYRGKDGAGWDAEAFAQINRTLADLNSAVAHKANDFTIQAGAGIKVATSQDSMGLTVYTIEATAVPDTPDTPAIEITDFVSAYYAGYNFNGKRIMFTDADYYASGWFGIEFNNGLAINILAGGGLAVDIFDPSNLSSTTIINGAFMGSVSYSFKDGNPDGTTTCVVSKFLYNEDGSGMGAVEISPTEFGQKIKLKIAVEG